MSGQGFHPASSVCVSLLLRRSRTLAVNALILSEVRHKQFFFYWRLMKWPSSFSPRFSFPLPSEGLLQCGFCTDTSSLFPCSYFFLFASSATLHIFLSFFTVSTVFHHPSPIPTYIHTIFSSIAFLSYFYLFTSSVSCFFFFLVYFHFTFSPSRFLTSALLVLKTQQPCRRLRGWTTPWSEGWWLWSSSSCSASSSSSADTSSDTKVDISSCKTHTHTQMCSDSVIHSWMNIQGKHIGIKMDSCEILLDFTQNQMCRKTAQSYSDSLV